MRLECDMCKKVVSENNIFHLNLAEPHNERIDWLGNGIFDGMVCKNCGKKVLKLFKNKIWVDKKYKKQLQGGLDQ